MYLSNCCPSLHKEGGKGIWCRKSINAECLKLPINRIEFDFGICRIILKNNHSKPSKSVILTCYKRNFEVYCDRLVLESIYRPYWQILLLLGDFNRDPIRDARDYNNLCDILASFNVLQIVNKPTRLDYILDYVYTNLSDVSYLLKKKYSSDNDAVTSIT